MFSLLEIRWLNLQPFITFKRLSWYPYFQNLTAQELGNHGLLNVSGFMYEEKVKDSFVGRKCCTDILQLSFYWPSNSLLNIIWFFQQSWWFRLATIKSMKADLSSVGSDEGVIFASGSWVFFLGENHGCKIWFLRQGRAGERKKVALRLWTTVKKK